ncbi:unnamed protein product, partial [Choristocarpus tenellus]
YTRRWIRKQQKRWRVLNSREANHLVFLFHPCDFRNTGHKSNPTSISFKYYRQKLTKTVECVYILPQFKSPSPTTLNHRRDQPTSTSKRS